MCSSDLLAAIGGVIERHLVEIGFMEGEGLGLKTDPQAEALRVGERPKGPACPNCGSRNLHMVEGCATCADCGHSKCS